MIDALAAAIALIATATALTVGVQVGVGRYQSRRVFPTLAMLEVALLVQVTLDLIGLARGHHPRETATHLAYLAASLVVLPVAAVETRGDDGPWSAVLLVVALLVLAVLVVRLQATWRSSGG